MQNLRERLDALDNAIGNEEKAIKKLEAEKQAIEEELDEGKNIIKQYEEDLKEANDVLTERSNELEAVKKRTSKAAKVLDQTLKDIATKVNCDFPLFVLVTDLRGFKNDDIEKLASERSAIYRKCRLEEIDLPLSAGDLRKVPIEEVSSIKDRLG